MLIWRCEEDMPIKNLNQEQKQAVTHTDGPLLIVAGAGTGKTTIITERVAWLIEEGLAKPDEILALTFTDKAAGEMEERVDRLLPYGYVDLWIMTFHSFCERILKNHALDIGLPNDFKLLNQTQQWMLVRENLDKFELDYYKPLGNPTKFIHALLKHFSRAKDEEISPADYLEYAQNLKINLDSMESTSGKSKVKNQKTSVINQPSKHSSELPRVVSEVEATEVSRLEEVANAYHSYQQLLLDNEALDFGDLINYTLKLFRQRPKALAHYRRHFKYILVDEFQDTNWAQYELVKLLAAPENNLTVVGDDDQSVFAFRGASMSNILHFKEDYPKVKQIFIKKNYRSVQNILDVAYNFIQLNNPERLEVKLKEGNSKQLLNKKLISQTKGRGQLGHLYAANEQKEVEKVVNQIIDLKNKDSQASWNDFAILARANKHLEPFINGLSFAGVPYIYVASKGLYEKNIIRDVLAYLKLLDNYHEPLALWRVLNFRAIDLPIEDLMQITNYANRKTYSLYEALNHIDVLKNVSTQGKKKIKNLLSLINRHSQLAKKKGVKELVLNFFNDFNIKQYLIEGNRHNDFNYLRELFNKIESFEEDQDDKSLANFMKLVSLEIESGEQGDLPGDAFEGPEAVRLMTIHGAKGLEFKYVFVVNMADKRFPAIERKDPIELPDDLVKEIVPSGDIHLQEERRLFYVALTRAKYGVWLSSAQNYGGKTKKKLSRFLYEANITAEPITDKKEEIEKDSPLDSRPRIVASRHQQKPYELPKSFSYSQIQAFEKCPYQYYLQFVLKIPTFGSHYFSYGKTMHAILQKFLLPLKQNGQTTQGNLFSDSQNSHKKSKPADSLPSFEKLLGLYKESWIDEWYESKEQKKKYYQQGIDSLKKIYEDIKNNPPQVLELEKYFNLKIGNYTLRGAMDRVDDLGEGKVHIVDYKTGNPKDKHSRQDKKQLYIYQLAASQVFNWQPQKLTFHYLNNNTQATFLADESDLEKTKQEIIEVIESILNYDFEALPDKHTCQYCDFKEVCRFRA